MFGFKKKQQPAPQPSIQEEQEASAGQPDVADSPQQSPSAEAEKPQSAPTYDPIHGDFGPFDGDSVDYREFDFSDFAKGGLDLGSIMIPVPHQGEVQVEMGPNGPQMIHILTEFGRVTPIAFAAPRGGGQWEESVQDIIAGMQAEGMDVTTEAGPWGEEIIGVAPGGVMRILGADGPRWMFRLTLASTEQLAPQMAMLGREIMSRSFVLRGQDPIPAGTSLPVHMPEALAQELAKQMAARQQAQQLQAQQPAPSQPAPEQSERSSADPAAPSPNHGG